MLLVIVTAAQKVGITLLSNSNNRLVELEMKHSISIRYGMTQNECITAKNIHLADLKRALLCTS